MKDTKDKKNNFIKKYTLLKFSIKELYLSNPTMFIFVVLLTALLSAVTPLKLLVWKDIINYIVEIVGNSSVEKNSIIYYFIAHFLLSLFGNVIQNVINYIQTIYAEYYNKNITIKILKKALTLDMIHYDDSTTYDIIKKASKNSLNSTINMLYSFISILRSLMTCISVSIIVINYSFVLVLLCLITTIPIFILNNKYLNRMFDVFNKKFENLRFIDYLKNLITNSANFKEIKILNTGKYLLEKISEIYDQNITMDKAVRKNFMIKQSGYSCIDILSLYILKAIALLKGLNQNLSIGSILIIIDTIDILRDNINNILSIINQIFEDILYVEFLYNLLNLELNEKDDDFVFNNDFKEIEFRNVSFRYPQTEEYVIKNFSYKFKKGYSYAIVGINGSGKTTLIKLLSGLYKPCKGEILIDGVNLDKINKDSYHKAISILFQDFVKYPFDILTNICISKSEVIQEKNEYELSDKLLKIERLIKTDRIVNKLPSGYYTKLIKGWKDSFDISSGEWQKIALARALFKDFEIIIFDEPTASIDLLSEKEIFDSIKSFNENKLYILISHRLFSIKDIDEILVLENGDLIESGNHQRLMDDKKLYYKLYTTYKED